MAETQLAVQPTMTLADQWNYANMVAGGTMLPDAYRNNPSNVLVAIGLGTSMGLNPAESLYRINVIKGKPTASGELIAANVRKAGHKLRISKDEQRVSVTATIVRADDPDAEFSVTRDMAWAQSMGLTTKDNYRKQPLTMLMWRAVTAVAREACPEALYGVTYTPDEMHDMEPAGAQPVEAQVSPSPAPQAHTAQNPQKPALTAEQAAFMADACERIAAATGRDLGDIKREVMAAHGDPREHLGDWEAYAAKVTETVEGMCPAAPSGEDALEPDDIEF